MSRKIRSFYFLAFFLSLLALVLISQELLKKQSTQLNSIIEKGGLRVSTTNSEDTYFLSENVPSGFEYELANAFATHLNVELQLTLRDSSQQLQQDIRTRDSHISIVGRSKNPPKPDNSIHKSLPYSQNQSVVVYRQTRGSKYPRKLEELFSRSIILAADSPQESLMLRKKQQYNRLQWHSSQLLTTYEILELVLAKEADIAIISLSEFQAIGPFFPGLKIAFKLGAPLSIHWMLANKEDRSLLNALNVFLRLESTLLLINQLEKKYYTNDNPLNFFDTLTFKNDFNQRFPLLEEFFIAAGQETDQDWMLLAAIAYQESHWDPNAVSSTGVKGIMMLTKAAAKEVGVTDRRDAKQSIFGGAKYLISVQDKIPERITNPDRTYLALAGYNTGFGHLEDARILTTRAGLNPDLWDDVKTRLPLLTKAKYYTTLKHGYARGYEPVNYVKNIRQYLSILQWEVKQRELKKALNTLPLDVIEPITVPSTDKPQSEEAPATL